MRSIFYLSSYISRNAPGRTSLLMMYGPSYLGASFPFAWFTPMICALYMTRSLEASPFFGTFLLWYRDTLLLYYSSLFIAISLFFSLSSCCRVMSASLFAFALYFPMHAVGHVSFAGATTSISKASVNGENLEHVFVIVRYAHITSGIMSAHVPRLLHTFLFSMLNC